jgi:hypothetical protein
MAHFPGHDEALSEMHLQQYKPAFSTLLLLLLLV